METKEGTEEGKGCCSKTRCCGGKALAALALLLIGGAGGYVCGRRCAAKDVAAADVPAQAK